MIAERINSEGERSKDGGLWSACKVYNALHPKKKREKKRRDISII